MCYLKSLWLFLGTILRSFVDLLANIGRLWAQVCGLAKIICARAQLPNRVGKGATTRCVKISDLAFKRPDPMIYAQYWLMSQGLAVTWDNPDIELRLGGVKVSAHDLKPDTEYEIIARIWNGSTEAPVVELPVTFAFLSFGAGTIPHFIGQTSVNLGVKGGSNHPAAATMLWRTPQSPGHYCIQVLLTWIDDANPNNNLGQTNTDVVTAHSPALSTFLLRNRDTERRMFHFEADAYVIPELPACQTIPEPRRTPASLMTAPGTVAVIPAAHDRRTQSLPAGWRVEFNPATPVLAPEEEVSIKITITPPASFSGSQTINLHAFTTLGLVGGVTLIVEG